ncbi:MAG: YihY/virulence factor BrkB family protein [Fibrobacter sp.]|nr:YihY/virulence factor BrkB family protein [Fibrobacter sp.]
MNKILSITLRLWRVLYRITKSTISHYTKHHGFTRASALTYTTLLAVIPLLILIHSIAGAFGIFDIAADLLPELNNRFQLGLPMRQLSPIIEKARMVGFKQLGLIGSAGLFVTFVAALENLETNFNVIWGVPKNRKLFSKILMSIPLLIFVVLAFAGVSGVLSYIKHLMLLLSQETPIGGAEVWKSMSSMVSFIGFHGLVFGALFVLYKVTPYTKVNTYYALFSAFLITILIRAFVWIFIALQSLFFLRMSLFYGSLAFIPLVMLLIYVLWSLVLFGNALAWRLQNWPP